MDDTSFAVVDNPELQRFEIDLGGGEVAIAEYRLMTGKIMFTHTEVPPSHEGQGIGTALIKAALASARERGLEVLPTCPFFAAYMKKHAEVQDLLPDYYRNLLGIDG